MSIATNDSEAIVAARANVATTESAQAAAWAEVDRVREAVAVNEANRSQLTIVQRKLADSQESHEQARALVRRLERDQVHVREAESRARQDEAALQLREGVAQVTDLDTRIGQWLANAEAVVMAFDEEAKEIHARHGGRVPDRRLTRTRAGDQLAGAISWARQLWPVRSK